MRIMLVEDDMLLAQSLTDRFWKIKGSMSMKPIAAKTLWN